MTTLYMLDTDTCSYILRRASPKLMRRIQDVSLDQQCISVISLSELLYGVQLSEKKTSNQPAIDALTRHVTVLDWPRAAAEHYADIRADLKKRGQIIGGNDLLIAAHARYLNATLVTNNVREFKRVKQLLVDNWMT